jgi:hypothetical protein
VIAATITAVIALVGVLVTVAANQYLARQDRLRKDFAEALAAVERYGEMPYRVHRRQGSTPETRERLSETIHEIQQDLLFHQSWVRIQSPQVAKVYDSLLQAMREEAGAAMTRAWNTAPITRDEDMPLGVGLSFPQMGQERIKYIEAVRYELELPPFQWLRDRFMPWLAERRDRASSHRNES